MLKVVSLLFLNYLVYAQDECLSSEVCVPIRSCEPIVAELKIAKSTSDSEKKAQIIESVREKICGNLEDKLICCPDKAEDNQGQESTEEVYLGKFVNLFHGIGGQVFKISDNQIKIKGFTYDGEGPDAFFLAGESGSRPNARKANDDIVLPYPFENQHFKYLDKNIPILGEFDGSSDVVLTLPPGYSASNLRWLSVWCRDYKVNFGHATFDQ